MSIKTILIIFIFLATCHDLIGQEKIGIPYTRPRKPTILDITKIYNKKTGERVPESEIHKIIRNNPSRQFERVIDRYGQISKYLYDPDSKGNSNLNNLKNSLVKGEPFPLFTYETIDGELLTSENLLGSIILIRFEVEPRTYKLQDQNYVQLVNLIKSNSQLCNIKSIVLFMYEADPKEFSEDQNSSVFSFVSDAFNFHFKYGIRRFPTTYLIDENGILLDIYEMGEEVELKLILCN